MIPFMMLIAMMAGMPANTMPVAMSMAFGVNQNDAMMTGLGMHLLTSTLIGVIFGAVTGSVDKLKITRFRKGIGEGQEAEAEEEVGAREPWQPHCANYAAASAPQGRSRRSPRPRS